MSAKPKGTTRFTIDLPSTLHKSFKRACVDREESMRTVLENFVSKYVELTNKKEVKP